mmetsp:Transcript_7603/g.11820  ORF Transcript_7603/g.11820 Transcript_7603/m.11820 type:complete len:124 (+) Transcript_7603:4070-4441(+)
MHKGESTAGEESVLNEANFEKLFRTAQQAKEMKNPQQKTTMIKRAKQTLKKIASQLQDLDCETVCKRISKTSPPVNPPKFSFNSLQPLVVETNTKKFNETSPLEPPGPKEPEQFLAYDEDIFA